MKIGPLKIELARTPPPKKTAEVGATGTVKYAGQIEDDFHEYNSSWKGEAKYDLVNEMRKSDPVIKMGLLLCTLPIKAATWSLTAASKDPQDELIARFVYWNLMERMTQSFNAFLDNAMLCLPFGFSLAEKVWANKVEIWEDPDTNAKVEVRPIHKLAPRLPHTTYRWNTDDNGGLETWEQRVYKAEAWQYVTIPADKLMLWSYQREGDNFEGESILRAAYKPWFFKKNAELVENIGYERNALGIPKMKMPQGAGEAENTRADAILQNLTSSEKSWVRLPEDWDLEIMKTTGTWSPATDLIRQRNYEIASSLLQQFILLGSTETGARAIAEVTIEPYYLALESMAGFIAEVVNKQLIPQLVDQSFEVKAYPKLEASKMQFKNIEVFSNAVARLLKEGGITPDRTLEGKIRDTLDLPVQEEGAEQPKADEDEGPNGGKKKPAKEETPGKGDEEEDESKTAASECGCGCGDTLHLSGVPRLPLPEESYLNLSAIEDRHQADKAALTEIVQGVRARQIDALVETIGTLLEQKDWASIPTVGVLYKNTIREQVKPILEAAYWFGREQVSIELERQGRGIEPDELLRRRHAGISDVSMADDGDDFKGFLESQAELISQQTSDELRQAAITAALAQGRQLAADEMPKFKRMLKEFLEELSPARVADLMSQSSGALFAYGRLHEAEMRAEDIDRTIYSAILDTRLCPNCQAKDGQLVAVDFPFPNPECLGGNRCRCLGVHVAKSEQEATVQ